MTEVTRELFFEVAEEVLGLKKGTSGKETLISENQLRQILVILSNKTNRSIRFRGSCEFTLGQIFNRIQVY